MPRRLIDLSIRWKMTLPPIRRVWPEDRIPDAQAPPRCGQILSRLKESDLPDGEGWRSNGSSCRRTTRRISTRHTIRLDHGSRKARHHHRWVPLEWCLNPGIKLDFRLFRTATWRRRWMLKPNSRALSTSSPRSIRAGEHCRRRGLRPEDYVAKGCGMGREATLYLLEAGCA